MKHTLLVTFGLLLSCSGGEKGATIGGDDDDGDDDDIVTDTDVPIPTETETEPVVDCLLGNNPYAVECTISLENAQVVTVELSAAGLATRTFHSEGSGTDHSIWAWGLRPDTTYDWTAAGVSGQVTTGSTPPALAAADIEVSGTLEGMDAVMLYVSCGFFAIVDGEGEIIGGVPTQTYDAFMDGMRWSQADRSFLAARDSKMGPGDSYFVEVHVSGTELLRIEQNDLVDLVALTHDLDRWGPYTYLQGVAPNGSEGFEVWEGTTHLGAYVLEQDFGLGESWLNGITVSETGEAILSERDNHAIISIDGDPNSPTFLELNWHAAGIAGIGLPNPDFGPAIGQIYKDQHHASLDGDDLWVFDNDSQPSSRALRMSMDPASGELTETGSWSVGRHCENQGGAVPVDGGVLVTCANSGDVHYFAEDSSTPDWSLNAACGGGLFSKPTRAYPVWVE